MIEKETPLSNLGAHGLVEHVSARFKSTEKSSFKSFGEDAVSVGNGNASLFGSSLLLEGIHFDLTYTPLQHLGYKAVVSAISDILAMNGKPRHVIVNLGLSRKMTLEKLDLLMSGISAACVKYGAELSGFRPTSSLTGLTISLSVTGYNIDTLPVTRDGAKPGDLICVSGDFGGALLGLHLLEREKRVLEIGGDQKPEFGHNDRVLQRQLKPEARLDVIEKLHESGIKPTSMTCVKDGLATSLLLLCKASSTGCRIYENRIPLDQTTLKVAKELNFNPLIAALNGGDDFELLFTIPLELYDLKKEIMPGDVTVLGYLTEPATPCFMISSQDQEIEIKAPGWGNSPAAT